MHFWQEEEALRSVEEKGPPLSAFWREKYEREARKSWDLFYRRNAGNFFKDRHCEKTWTGREGNIDCPTRDRIVIDFSFTASTKVRQVLREVGGGGWGCSMGR